MLKCTNCGVMPANTLLTDGLCSVCNVNKKHRDNVEHPSHYADSKVECIDAIESALTPEGFEGALVFNCIKYLWRYRQKGGVESLKKCRFYLNRLIDFLESK